MYTYPLLLNKKVIPNSMSIPNTFSLLQAVLTKSGQMLPYFTHKDIAVSAGERKVQEALNALNIKWVREVSFTNFRTAKGGHYRFDFLLIRRATIIEYDGKRFHLDKTKDKIKDAFCKKNGLKVIRFSGGADFYNMKERIKQELYPDIKPISILYSGIPKK